MTVEVLPDGHPPCRWVVLSCRSPLNGAKHLPACAVCDWEGEPTRTRPEAERTAKDHAKRSNAIRREGKDRLVRAEESAGG